MSCNCAPVDKTSLWTPIPELKQPTEILPGENIDCFSRRAGNQSGLQDDAQDDLVSRIQNVSITPSSSLVINETFTLSKGPKAAARWTIKFNPPLPTVSINNSGVLAGTIPGQESGNTFTADVSAIDEYNVVIDERQFTFVPVKNPAKGESLTLLLPYRSTNGQAPRVSSGFGPRLHPIHKVMKLHGGQDWVGGGAGEILAAADGEVVFSGVAGGYGNQVRINHLSPDGSVLAQTSYAHCKKLLVTVGQKVGAGQCIALEGTTGASTGPHLHFELLLGGKQLVDPAPYIRGTFTVQPPRQSDNTLPNPVTFSNSGNKALTVKEVEARTSSTCPAVVDSGAAAGPSPIPPPIAASDFNNQMSTTSGCIPAIRPSLAFVNAEIDRALNPNGVLTNDDRNLIRFIARIESRFDPFAKNPTSSATGLYQMLDSTAVRYFGILGIPATCANRCNPYYATLAMILFYNSEIKAYWTEFNNSGKLRIAGKPIKITAHSARYASLTMGEFCYGLVHHDGIGNAVNGVDKQGIDYFRKKAIEIGFA